MTKKILLLSALVLMLSSCEGALDDVFGEWSRPVPATISYATTSITKIFGDDDFTIELTNTGDGTVTYSSSNTAVAEVNASTGLVTLKGGGDATITATVTNSDKSTYAIKTVTYNLTVRDAFVYYDLSSGEAVKKAVLAEDCKVIDSDTKNWDDTKTLVVKNDVTITGKVIVTNEVKLILCDGAKLTINGQIYYTGDLTNQTLNIFAQSTGSEVGQISVNANDVSYKEVIKCYALNIHGGKLEFINQYTGTDYNDAISTPHHDIMIYGGDVKAQSYSGAGDGIQMAEDIKVVISGGKLVAIGGDDNSNSCNGGAGIYGGLLAKGNAIVFATGGNGRMGGAGVEKKAEISGNAYVESTGGESTYFEGGRGFTSSLTVSENATVKAKGGISTNDDGGNGASSSLTIKDNANVTAIGGNTTSGNNGGYGVSGYFYYYGGKFTIESGKNASNIYYYAIASTLYNKTADAVSFERKKSDTDWTSFSVDGNSVEVMNNPKYIAVRKQ